MSLSDLESMGTAQKRARVSGMSGPSAHCWTWSSQTSTELLNSPSTMPPRMNILPPTTVQLASSLGESSRECSAQVLLEML